MGLEGQLQSQLLHAAEAVKDGIAKEGLIALKKVLDSAGFVKSPYLKNYEVFSYVASDGVTFEILLELESVDIDLKKVEKAAAEAAEAFEKSSKRVYKIITKGGFSRVARMKDNRKPVPSALNRPPRTKSNLKQWGDRGGYVRNHLKGADERKMQHGMAMGAPRDMNINREGKLSVQFSKQTRTTKSGEIHLPQGKFQGIMKQFMDELQKIIAKQFAPELESMIQSWLE